MDDLPVYVIGFDNMILLVCPPSPRLKPLESPSECDSDFQLEKTRRIRKAKHAHKNPKTRKNHHFTYAL